VEINTIQIGCVVLEWTNFQILWPRIKIMKPYLPRSIFSQLERITGRSGPSREQLRKISSLGKSVGLEKHEIIAAIDAPIAKPGIGGKDRASLYITLILVTIIVAIGILITWYVVDPESFPIKLYTPGTLYGSIRPQDFANRSFSAIMN